jgi:hypothetical protein
MEAKPHVLGGARTGVAMHRDRGVLVHARHVVADMAVNLHVKMGIEPAGHGVRAVGILHLNLRYAFIGRLPVQI